MVVVVIPRMYDMSESIDAHKATLSDNVHSRMQRRFSTLSSCGRLAHDFKDDLQNYYQLWGVYSEKGIGTMRSGPKEEAKGSRKETPGKRSNDNRA